MSILKNLTPAFLSRRCFEIKTRLDNLETSVQHLNSAVDAIMVSPRYIPGQNVGFNAQRHRKKIFSDIMGAINFDLIIETGTWLGDTTGFMRQTSGKPVYSCEVNSRFAALAKTRLSRLDQIHLELKDSRMFLSGLQKSDCASKTAFFYLDAHWYDDLPLSEEMDMIGSGWRNYVVLIDDFKVPDDSGYGYDNYGPGRALELSLLNAVIKKFNLAVFFVGSGQQRNRGKMWMRRAEAVW